MVRDGEVKHADVFAGNSEMARRCRAFDWTATPIGPVEGWPVALRTAVRLMLGTPVATCLWVGESYTLIFNDSYRLILGAKHRYALGRPGPEVWDDVWPGLEQQFAQVRSGGPSVYEDEAQLRMARLEGGQGEDAWFTYSLSALTNDSGECIAVYNLAVETSTRVRARAAVEEERFRLLEATRLAPTFVCFLRGPDFVFEYANDAYLTLIGHRDVLGKPVLEALPELRDQGFETLLTRVLHDGEPYVGRDVPVRIARTPGSAPEERYVDFLYQPLSEPDGTRSGVMVHGSDVTDHLLAVRALEETNAQLQQQTLESEAQAEELQATTEQLAERTAAAEEAVGRTERLQALTAALAAARTVDDVAEVVVAEVWATVEASTAELFLRVRGTDQADTVRHSGVDDATLVLYRRFPFDAPGAAARCMRTGTPVFVEGRDGDDGLLESFPDILDIWERLGTHAIASVPLAVADEVTGAMCFTYDAPRTFSDDDRAFFLAVAQQAAQALERARLFEAERQATDRAQRLQRLIGRLNEATSAEQIADAVFDGGLEAVGADAGSLALVHPDESGKPAYAEVIRTAGFNSRTRERYQRFPIKPGRPLSEAVLSREPTLIGSPEEWLTHFPSNTENLSELGFEAFACIPVVVSEQAVAALSFTFLTPREFDQSTRTFLVTLGEQCALALGRQRAHEAQLREAAQRAALLDTIHDPFVAFDRDVRYTYVNAQAESVLRHTRAELLGRRLEDVFPSISETPFGDAIRRALENDEAGHVEAFSPALARWLDVRMYPAPDGVSVVFQDVTERRRAQESATFMAEASRLLTASLDYEETLAALARAAVPTLGDWCAVDMLVDPDIKAWPPAVRRIAVMHQDPAKIEWARNLERELPQDWEAGTGLARVLRDGATEFYPKITDEMLVAASKSPEELEKLRAIGIRAYLCVPIAARGRIFGALTLCTTESARLYDETDRALAEDLAQRAATAVDNALLLRDAERARDEAEAANRAKSQFLTTMSHELRTPLNAIGGYTELIEMGIRGPVTAEQRGDLERIQRNQIHLLGLINEVLNYARLESGTVSYGAVEIPVATALTNVESLILPQARAKSLALGIDSCSSELAVRGDPEKLQQILVNVLSNAVKFTNTGGSIAVSCHVRENGHSDATEMVEISVTDTGIGIAAEELERVFEPFVQVGRALNSPGEGTGLGLAISRDLARGMGGELSATSKLDVGSTFTLTLPRAK